jgi:hypothetical protein
MKSTFALLAGLALSLHVSAAELSSTIKNLLLNKDSGAQDFMVLKKHAKNIKFMSGSEAMQGDRSYPGANYSKIYRGEMQLEVGGKPFMLPTMEDARQNWTVYIAGPNANADVLFIRGDQVASPGGASYFRGAGLTLLPLACKVIDPNNYEAFYTVQVAGKHPAVLQISKSTGSAGVWYSYGLYWIGPPVKDLPQDVLVGECAVKD